MKKIELLTVAILLAGGYCANAQTITDSPSNERNMLILKAGLNITRQNLGASNVNVSSRGAFHGGVAFNLYTGARGLSIQPELNFIGKGASLKSGTGESQKLNLSYLELPVLVKYRFGVGYVNAGPSLGLRLNNPDNIGYGKSTGLDFGLQMGAGLSIPTGSGRIIIDGRYGLGLTNLAKESPTRAKNRGVSFALGYAFPISK